MNEVSERGSNLEGFVLRIWNLEGFVSASLRIASKQACPVAAHGHLLRSHPNEQMKWREGKSEVQDHGQVI